MRIPIIPLADYLIDSGLKSAGSRIRTEPIDGAARRRAASPGTPTRSSVNERDGRMPSPAAPFVEERRKGERRRGKFPVLLNTRLGDRRQEHSFSDRI